MAHAHHAGFGHRRFGERRQHGCGYVGRSMLGVRATAIIERHGMAGVRKLQRQQTAHQAAADDG